jgi:hypothetical protein
MHLHLHLHLHLNLHLHFQYCALFVHGKHEVFGLLTALTTDIPIRFFNVSAYVTYRIAETFSIPVSYSRLYS